MPTKLEFNSLKEFRNINFVEESLDQASLIANFHPVIEQETFSIGLMGKGFYSLEKHLFLKRQKRLMNVGIKEAPPSN